MDEAALKHGGAQAKRSSSVVIIGRCLAHGLASQRACLGDDGTGLSIGSDRIAPPDSALAELTSQDLALLVVNDDEKARREADGAVIDRADLAVARQKLGRCHGVCNGIGFRQRNGARRGIGPTHVIPAEIVRLTQAGDVQWQLPSGGERCDRSSDGRLGAPCGSGKGG